MKINLINTYENVKNSSAQYGQRNIIMPSYKPFRYNTTSLTFKSEAPMLNPDKQNSDSDIIQETLICRSTEIGGKSKIKNLIVRPNFIFPSALKIKDAARINGFVDSRASKLSIDISGNAFVNNIQSRDKKIPEVTVRGNSTVNNAFSINKLNIRNRAYVDSAMANSIIVHGNTKNDKAIINKSVSEYFSMTNAQAKDVQVSGYAELLDSKIEYLEATQADISDSKVEKLSADIVNINGNSEIGDMIVSQKASMSGKGIVYGDIVLTSDDAELEIKDDKEGNIPRIEDAYISGGFVNFAFENPTRHDTLSGHVVKISKNTHVDTLLADNGVAVEDNATAKNIVVKGKHPSVYLGENAIISDKVIFEDAPGVLYVDRNYNMDYPEVKNGTIVIGTEKDIKSGKTDTAEGFEKVAGNDGLKNALRESVIDPLKKLKLYASYNFLPNSAILYGPSGCGKTFIAQALAEETGRYIVKINPDEMKDRDAVAMAQNIAEKFKEAEDNIPSIIFIDKIEELSSSEYQDGNMKRGPLDELIKQLNNFSKNFIFVVATSNNPKMIDNKVKNVFDKKILVTPPDLNSRKIIFENCLEDIETKGDIDYEELSQKTKYYTFKDIKIAVNEASRITEDATDMDDLREAISKLKPSVKKEEIRQCVIDMDNSKIKHVS